MEYADSYQLYKPRKQGEGAAFSLSYSNSGLYLKIAKQIGTERRFDWENATVIRLDHADLASILDMIENKTKVEIFHDAGKFKGARNPVQKGLNAQYNDSYHNYFWNLWRKEGEATLSVGVAVSLGETAIIKRLIGYVIPFLFKWDKVIFSDPRQEKTSSQPPTTPLQQVEEIGIDEDEEPFPSRTPDWAKQEQGKPEMSEQEKVAEILQLTKNKLGATTAGEAKKKVSEETGLEFIRANLDIMLKYMRNY